MATNQIIFIGKIFVFIKNIHCLYFSREFVLMYRKMIFIFFSVISSLPNENKCVILLMISSFSLYATLQARPCVLRELNILEVESNIAALITIFAGSLYILDVADELKILVFFFIIIINTIFAVRWLLAVSDIVFLSYEKTILRCCPCLANNFAIFKKTIAETRFNYNLPRFFCQFWSNFSINKREFTLVKL